MIYFIQDTEKFTIKIGHTEKDTPEARRRACQTGNSALLTILAAIPGEEKDEKALHDRFAKHRLMGEWFSPATEILALVIAAKPQRLHLAADAAPELDFSKWPLNIYLAGKISSKDWRHSIVRWRKPS